MKKILRGNMLIAQSGGPSMVINRSLVGAITEAKKHGNIQRIYGALHGVKGILEEDFIDFRRETPATLQSVAETPSSALGTVRKKVALEDCRKILDVLKKYNVRYFFYIGGNDTADNARIISEEAEKTSFELRCFHIPKTIDNDLMENDHTPGFGSAAKFVACALMGINLDNRAMPGVHISIIMGRHAGFLTAASALARVYPDDGPHLIYFPERPFSMRQFVKDVQKTYKKLGRCVVTVSEGISDENMTPIAAKFIKEVDSHGNVQLSGSGALGDMLAVEIRTKTNISRVRADTFGYLQRSFPGIISATDAGEAWRVGVEAVKHALKTKSGSIAIRRKPTKKYQVYFECVPLENVAKKTTKMPAKFINTAGNDVTKAFMDYVKPIVGDLPAIGRLKGAGIK